MRGPNDFNGVSGAGIYWSEQGFSIPREHLHIDKLEWYCIGHREHISDLLCNVTALGKKRGVGGRAKSWSVRGGSNPH